MSRLFVATCGYKRITKYLLQYYGINECVHDIITPMCIGKPEGFRLDTKNELLDYAKREYNVQTALLVDHNAQYVHAARVAGHIAYQVDHFRGITKRDVMSIDKLVKFNSVDGVFVGMDDTLFEGHVTPQYIFNVLVGGVLGGVPDVRPAPGVGVLTRKL